MPQSLDDLRRALLFVPGKDAVTARLAEFHGRRGNWEQAALLVRRAVILAPGITSYHYLHAMCLGNRDAAGPMRLALRRAMLLSPQDRRALEHNARVLAWAGDANRAELEYRRLALLAPDNPQCWRLLAEHMASRRLGHRTVPLIRRALLLDPGNAKDWQSLHAVSVTAQDTGAGIVAARRLVCCGPASANIWMWLATRERALGNIARSARILGMLEKSAPFNPALRLMLAVDRHGEGRAGDARDFLERFFHETHRRLTSPDARFAIDEGARSFLTCNLFAGRFEAVTEYYETARRHKVEGTGILSGIGDVAAAMSAYFTDPVRWKGDERLIVSVPVWGRKFADLWLENGLASMMTPANCRLWDRQETAFHIITTRETREYLCGVPSFAKLQDRYHVAFLDIGPVLRPGYGAGNHSAMIVAQWLSFCIAQREQAGYFSLVADYVFSASALGYVAELLDRDAADILYSIDFPVSETAAPLLENWRDQAGILSIPERDLADLFLDHPSLRVAYYAISENADSLPTDPSRLNIIFGQRQGKEQEQEQVQGIQIRSMQPQLVYAGAGALKDFWAPRLSATDNGFADSVLLNIAGTERMMMLNDATRFGCAVIEVDEAERGGSGHFPKRQAVAASLEEELLHLVRHAHFLTPARIWGLRSPMNVMRQGVEPDPEACKFLDDFAAGLSPVGDDDFAMVMQEIGWPLFRKFVAGLSAAGADPA